MTRNRGCRPGILLFLFSLIASGFISFSAEAANPVANREAAASLSAGTITVRGWAFDPDVPSQSITVRIYVGDPALGSPYYDILAGDYRADVNQVHSITGNHGFDTTIRVSRTGQQKLYFFALNVGAGNLEDFFGNLDVNILADTTSPTISNVTVSNLTVNGYTVSCKVTDDVGVTSVKFPTWTSANGQDDIIWHDGTISGSTATCHIKRSDHKNEYGTYITHIYAYDAAGNTKTSSATASITKCLAGHSWNSGTVTAAAACTADGEKTFTCTVCGQTRKEAIPKLGHSWNSAYTVDRPATCTSAGAKSIHCSRCTATKDTQAIPATGHVWDSGHVTKEPTAAEEGIKVYLCTICGVTRSESISKLPATETPATEAPTTEAPKTETPAAESPSEQAPQGTKASESPAPGTTDGQASGKSISSCTLTLSAQTYVYCMQECKPVVKLTSGSTVLKENKDYTVQYKNNVNAGTASVTVRGMGNYTGTKTASFTIQKAGQKFSGIENAVSLTAGDSMSLVSARVISTISGSYGKMTVISEETKTYKSSDPSVATVDKNGMISAIKAGNAKITISDPGNSNFMAVSFTCSVSVKSAGGAEGAGSTVSRKTHISACSISLGKNSYTYTGKKLKPEVTVSYNGKTLKAGTDYTVSYLNNLNAGEAIVRVGGKGGYTGQKEVTFTIARKKQVITAKNITLTRSSKKRTKKLSVKVKDGAKIIYTLSDKKLKIRKNAVTIPAGYVGSCKIKIKTVATQNYAAGSKNITLKVLPPATRLTGLTADKSKKLYKISWKAVSNVSGYEAQMALSAQFRKPVKKVKGKNTSATFSYETGKTYCFRVRAYKKVGGKTYYSKWSEVEYKSAR